MKNAFSNRTAWPSVRGQEKTRQPWTCGEGREESSKDSVSSRKRNETKASVIPTLASGAHIVLYIHILSFIATPGGRH